MPRQAVSGSGRAGRSGLIVSQRHSRSALAYIEKQDVGRTICGQQRRAVSGNIAFNRSWCRMKMLPQERAHRNGDGNLSLVCRRLGFCLLAAVLCLARAYAQEDPLNKVHVEPPAEATPDTGTPKGAEKPAESGPGALKIHPGSFIRMNVDLVLVPVTVTDPMNRLVTGLEKEDFQIFENNKDQKIRTFASEDAFLIFRDR